MANLKKYKILSIKKIGYDKVIDFSCEPIPYYISNNMISHNCHNPKLVLVRNKWKLTERIKEDKIINFIKSKNKTKKWVDAISICGGEPTTQWSLIKFCEKIKKELGILIKVDTNGTNPRMLRKLISRKLVDYVAMDVKVDLFNRRNYNLSIKLVKKMKNYEFRLTAVPTLVKDDNIEQIAEKFKGAKRFYIQQFNNKVNMLNNKYKDIKPYKRATLEEWCKKIKKNFDRCEVRA